MEASTHTHTRTHSNMHTCMPADLWTGQGKQFVAEHVADAEAFGSQRSALMAMTRASQPETLSHIRHALEQVCVCMHMRACVRACLLWVQFKYTEVCIHVNIHLSELGVYSAFQRLHHIL